MVDGINREGEEVDYERSDDTEEEEEEGSNDVDDFVESEDEKQKMLKMKDEIAKEELKE